MPKIRRHLWKWIAAIALAGAALAWYWHAQQTAHSFDWRVAASSLSRIRWPWLLLSLVPLGASYYGRALRWAVFLRPLKARVSMANLTSATVIGFTAITLFGRPGEFVRPYLIAVKERVPVTSQLAAWVLERIFDLLMALLLFAFALTRVRTSSVRAGSNLAWVLLAGGRIVGVTCVALLVVLVSLRHFAEPLKRRLLAALGFLTEKHFLKVEKMLGAFIQGVESTRSDAALVAILLYSLLEWGLIVACYWCLSRSFAGMVTLSFVDVLIFMGFVSFGAVVQIPGIGGGVQVVAIVVLTELFGVRLELATSFAFLIWALTFVAVVPIGLILAVRQGLDWRNLRQIGREAAG